MIERILPAVFPANKPNPSELTIFHDETPRIFIAEYRKYRTEFPLEISLMPWLNRLNT
jgi:hypothetical protein